MEILQIAKETTKKGGPGQILWKSYNRVLQGPHCSHPPGKALSGLYYTHAYLKARPRLTIVGDS